MNFPDKYIDRNINFSDYCEKMAVNRTEATSLQIIADICFAVVECYCSRDYFVPIRVFEPLRAGKMSECKRRIRLWIQPGHCLALIDPASKGLIQNIPDESEMPQPVSFSADSVEEEEEDESNEEELAPRIEVEEVHRDSPENN